MAAKILIVDDEADVCQLLATALRDEGYEVGTAKDGDDAMREFACFRPDLILLDVMIPEQDGFLVCAKIKLIEPAPKVVFVTALPEGESDRMANYLHSDGIIHKPFTIRQILEMVRQLLSVAPASA